MTGAKPPSLETHLFISGNVQGVCFRAKQRKAPLTNLSLESSKNTNVH